MQMLLKFKSFIDELKLNTSRNYKISILEKYKDDEDIKYLLDFIYNPYIITGISKKKINKDVNITFDYDEDASFKDLLEYLKTHNTGRDEDLAKIVAFDCYHFSPESDKELYELFQNIITKNLQLGIDIKTINKVIPDLIPTFDVQLANKYFDRPYYVNNKKFAITTKIDGSRIIALKDNDGKISFWTRQGQPYEGLVDLEGEMQYFPRNICLDGELVAVDTDKENTYKNTMKLSRTKDQEKHGLKMRVFDCMSCEEFKLQISHDPYYLRRILLDDIFDLAKNYKLGILQDQQYSKEEIEKEMRQPFHYFEKVAILYQGTDKNKILEILEQQVNEGEEGVMINIVNAPYHFSRTWDLLKVKKFKDTELKIIGFEEGTNKHEGKLGAFVCEYKNNIVKVGSGLSDEDREYFWNNQDKYLGKYITVKYFEETYDSKTHLPSLRFPTYLRIREDI